MKCVVTLSPCQLQLPMAPMLELGDLRHVAKVPYAASKRFPKRLLGVAPDLVEPAPLKASLDLPSSRGCGQVECLARLSPAPKVIDLSPDPLDLFAGGPQLLPRAPVAARVRLLAEVVGGAPERPKQFCGSAFLAS